MRHLNDYQPEMNKIFPLHHKNSYLALQFKIQDQQYPTALNCVYQIYKHHLIPHRRLPQYSQLTHGNTKLAATGALTHLCNATLLQHRTDCKIQNSCQGAPKWPRRSGKGLLTTQSHFCYISFLIRALLLCEKVATEKIVKKYEEKKILEKK